MSDEDGAAAFTDYFSVRRSWLRSVAYMLCQDWHRADDLLQTTAIRLYARWHRAAQLEQLDAYVRRILVNAYLAELRSPWWKRVAHREGTDNAVDAPDPAAGLDLRAALAALPPRQRATVVLRYYDELSVRETAEVMGCSPGVPNMCLHPDDLETSRWARVARTRAAQSTSSRRDAGPGGLRPGQPQ